MQARRPFLPRDARSQRNGAAHRYRTLACRPAARLTVHGRRCSLGPHLMTLCPPTQWLSRAITYPAGSTKRGCVAITCLCLVSALSSRSDECPWPGWRGLSKQGAVVGATCTTHWATNRNVCWKSAIPGEGHSSPIVWGNRVFVTTAVGEGKEAYLKVGRYGQSPDNPEDYPHHYRLYCIDRDSGEIVWERTAFSGKPKVSRHVKSSHANCTPATDGKNVIAFFGSQGLYCYDFEGNLKW